MTTINFETIIYLEEVGDYVDVEVIISTGIEDTDVIDIVPTHWPEDVSLILLDNALNNYAITHQDELLNEYLSWCEITEEDRKIENSCLYKG